ncbi:MULTISPECIES: LysR family transcriptional regulator [unclassified Luteibacter]|uniref:LysR family transcriptional regulator n=1 Tax=unclassified Luteibacter TaxID=2620188 RepID=UPI0015A536C0|nr:MULTISPECIES: LysR family transcriptional regulator [unclassified Luteibacter]MDR6937896.1 DNA-binding transcriptional LysR family regulator [Luteibacter sp. 3190]
MNPARKSASRPPTATPAPRGAGDEAGRFYYKGNRLKQLRAFVYTTRLGTLSRAAEALFLSQPSISLQIKALERELGAVLLERTRRRVTLTDAGEALYEMARPLVEGFEGLDREFHTKTRGAQAGKLTVAAGSSTIQYLLPELVKAYRERYPTVHLQLANVTGKDGLALLRADEADIAIGSMLDVPNDIAWAPVYHYDPMLIMPPDHPLAARDDIRLEDLSPYGLILPPQRLTTFRLVDMVFQQRRVPYTVAIEVGGWDVIKQYVAMGLGISIVTGICITDADRERLAVRNLRRYFPQRSYGVVMRKGKFLSPEARAFIDLIRPGLLTHRDYDEPGHSER